MAFEQHGFARVYSMERGYEGWKISGVSLFTRNPFGQNCTRVRLPPSQMIQRSGTSSISVELQLLSHDTRQVLIKIDEIPLNQLLADLTLEKIPELLHLRLAERGTTAGRHFLRCPSKDLVGIKFIEAPQFAGAEHLGRKTGCLPQEFVFPTHSQGAAVIS